MKKTLLAGLVAMVSLLATACSDSAKGGDDNGGEPTTSYVVSKVKNATEGTPLDFIDLNYASTDPLVIKEISMFVWDSEMTAAAPKRTMRTKAMVLDVKMVLKNFVATDGKMTCDVMVAEKGAGEPKKVGTFEITIDAQGRATALKATPNGSMENMETGAANLSYNADGYLAMFEQVTSNDSDKYEFTYSGGNVTKCVNTYSYTMLGEKHEDVYETVYSDYNTENKGGIMNPAMMNTEGFLDLFVNLRLTGKPAAMLPSKADAGEGDIYAFTYEKDANGCISKMTSVNSYTMDGEKETDTEIFTYEYLEVVSK